MNDLSVRRFTEPALSAGDSSSHTDAYSRQLSSEGFDPATVKSKGAKVSHSPDNSLDSAATGTPGTVFVSSAVAGGSGVVGGTQTDKYVPTSAVSEGEYTLNKLESTVASDVHVHWVTSIFTSRPVCDIWLFAAKGVVVH